MSHRHVSPRLLGAILFVGLFAACSQRSGAAAPGDNAAPELFHTAVVTASPVATAAAERGLPDFADLVAQVGSAVVNVQVVEKGPQDQGDDQGDQGNQGDQGGGGGDQDDPFGDFFRRFGIPAPNMPRQRNFGPVRGIGSGFIISSNGYILTNAHVVNNATKVTVRLTDRREFQAKVIGVDERTDIAVIKIEVNGKLPVVSVGNSDALRPGQWVLAIGSPFNFENTVTSGIVSATARPLNNSLVPFIQTDVPVNPGNSGGPLFNLSGQVVGINSEIYSQTGAYEGISFAIPINVAVNVADQLIKTGHVVRGRIGVTIQEVTAATAENLGLPYPRGAAVASVESGGPADKAGIQPLDIILSVDGTPVRDSDELPSMIAEIRPGQTVHLQVWRDKRTINVDVRIGVLPENNATASNGGSGGGGAAPGGSAATASSIGLSVRTLTAAEKRQLKTRGNVVVTDVRGPAAEAMLQPGDVILSINRVPINDVAAFQKAVKSGGHDWTLLIQRDENGMPQQLIVTISLQ
ncbi:MAG TPA: Do family serine endopeptidase [Steroidobacteraceae bacterium]|jgi:serine protease Do|nr:Do family serine endopeptidase [Steroidobacteraceae bacterium]